MSEDIINKPDQKQGGKHFPEDGHAPQSQTTNHILRQAQDDNKQTMEVHKHPHHVTHKKKFGEYLLEFFMLFLAVFLGFIAENVRENIVEKERTERYMHAMVENLKYDTTRYGRTLRANL